MTKMFDPALIEAIHAEYLQQYGDFADNIDSYCMEVGEGRTMLSIRMQGALLDPALYAHPILISILQGLLGRDLLIDSATCVTAVPGASLQHLHRDHPLLFEDRDDPGRLPYAITVAIPLIDLDESTGTTKLFLGSHLAPADGKFTLPFVSRGGCYLVDYRLCHQGTANRSTRSRPILYLTYSRSWFIDGVNFTHQPRINIAEDDLSSIPQEHRPLFRRVPVTAAMTLNEE